MCDIGWPSQKSAPDIGDYTVAEQCPYCENEIIMRWSVEEFGYKALCPVCGNAFMLCSECRKAGGKFCDYSDDTKTCRLGSTDRYPELREYKEHRLEVSARPDDPEWLGCFEIVFEAEEERYYCYIIGDIIVNHLSPTASCKRVFSRAVIVILSHKRVTQNVHLRLS